MPKTLRVEGHRGAITHHEENSLEAFLEADRLGIDGIEFDLWLLKDGVPVIGHGKSGNGLEIVWNTAQSKMETVFLPQLASTELATYRYPDRKTRIVTFEAALAALKDSKLFLNAEIKDCRPELVRALLEVIGRVRPTCPLGFSSFNHGVRPWIDQAAAELGLGEFTFGYLVWQTKDLPKLVDGGPEGLRKGDQINVDITLILAKDEALRAYLARARELGYEVKVYNLMVLTEFETPELYETLVDWGVDTFICNRVEKLMDFNRGKLDTSK